MKINKEAVWCFFIPHIIFIVLVTITDNIEVAIALSAQSFAFSAIFGFLLSFLFRRNKKYAFLLGSILALIYILVS